MKKVTVYTKQDCPACKMTKQLMDKLGVIYEVVDITNDEKTKEKLIQSGWRSLPVVEWVDEEGMGDGWSGFIPDNIKEIANYYG